MLLGGAKNYLQLSIAPVAACIMHTDTHTQYTQRNHPFTLRSVTQAIYYPEWRKELKSTQKFLDKRIHI